MQGERASFFYSRKTERQKENAVVRNYAWSCSFDQLETERERERSTQTNTNKSKKKRKNKRLDKRRIENA
jgi:hypothetical protein